MAQAQVIDGAQIERAGAPFYLGWQYPPLWPLVDNIRDAAERYAAKFGHAPNTVYLHPSKVPEGAHIIMAGCVVLPRDGVRPGIMWVGWEGGR
jgi:hypothetical protein